MFTNTHLYKAIIVMIPITPQIDGEIGRVIALRDLSVCVCKLLVHNAVFRLSIACSVPEIFAIKVQSCPKSSALLLTHEPLHLAWCNFGCSCTLTTSRTFLDFKVIGQRSRSHGFFGVFLCVCVILRLPADST